MFEEKSHLSNKGPRLVRVPYHHRLSSKLHHNQELNDGQGVRKEKGNKYLQKAVTSALNASQLTLWPH